MLTFDYDRLKSFREIKGLSREQFADLIGVSPNSAKNWELGKTSPRASDLTNIFNSFDIDPSAFWMRIQNPDPTPTNGAK